MINLSLVLLLTLAAPARTQGFVIVVHPDSGIESVRRAELSKIFLGRLRTWSDGTPALPVDQPPDRPVRERFSRTVHGRSVVRVEVYWKRMIFSGRAVPPAELSNDLQVLDFVRTYPGGVGYINEATDPAGVRKLTLSD